MSLVSVAVKTPPIGLLPTSQVFSEKYGFPEPFPGFMKQAVDAYMKAAFKPQPELATLASLIAMASALGGGYALVDGTRLNLYGLGVISTADGKDRVGELARSIAIQFEKTLCLMMRKCVIGMSGHFGPGYQQIAGSCSEKGAWRCRQDAP